MAGLGLWKPRWDGVLVALAAGLVFFLNLGGIALWDEDEPKNAVCAREMFERGDWLVPTFNGQLRTDKPILLYWLMLAAYHAFGVTEFAARVWSAVLATITVLLTYDLGRRVGVLRVGGIGTPSPPRDERNLLIPSTRGGEGDGVPTLAGLWSGLALCGSLLFGVSARAATPDATLIVCTTAGLCLWASAFLNAAPLTGKRWLAVYALFGLAILAKGPSGLVLPVAVILVAETLSRARTSLHFSEMEKQSRPSPDVPPRWLWAANFGGIRRRVVSLARQAWESAGAVRVIWGCGLALLVAAPWYVAVAFATDGAWPAGFLGRHNVQRFLGPLEGHGGPIIYYIPAVLIGLLPWSLWLPAALAAAWRRMRTRSLDRADLLLLSWIGVYLVVFSFAGTKLPSYVLPCYPALAVLIGRHLAMRVERLPAGPFIAWTLIGFALAGAFFAGGHWIAREVAWLAVLGLIPAAGGLLAWTLNRNHRPHLALGTFSLSAVALFAGLFGVAADTADERQTPVAFARRIRETAGGDVPVATLDAFRPTLVFYTGGTVTDCPTPESAAEFLARSPEAFLVTRDEHWARLKPLLPPEACLLARERMFLRKFDLLLIGRPREVAGILHFGEMERR